LAGPAAGRVAAAPLPVVGHLRHRFEFRPVAIERLRRGLITRHERPETRFFVDEGDLIAQNQHEKGRTGLFERLKTWFLRLGRIMRCWITEGSLII